MTTYTIAQTDARGRVEKYLKPNYTSAAEALEAARKIAKHWPIDQLRIYVAYNRLYRIDDFEKRMNERKPQ